MLGLALRFGTQIAALAGAVVASASHILLEDNTSRILLEDGTFLLLEA